MLKKKKFNVNFILVNMKLYIKIIYFASSSTSTINYPCKLISIAESCSPKCPANQVYENCAKPLECRPTCTRPNGTEVCHSVSIISPLMLTMISYLIMLIVILFVHYRKLVKKDVFAKKATYSIAMETASNRMTVQVGLIFEI